MPMRMIGRKLMIGCGSEMRPSQPSCQIATVRPNVAATDRPKPTAAMSGTQIERNTSMSRMNARTRTMPTYGSSTSLSRSEMSSKIGVTPVTE